MYSSSKVDQLSVLISSLASNTTIICSKIKNDKHGEINWEKFNLELERLRIISQELNYFIKNNEEYRTWGIRYFLRLWDIIYFQLDKINKNKDTSNNWVDFDHIRFMKQYDYVKSELKIIK